MQCTSCGAEIAEKAIVCYRCGAPTAIPAAPRRHQAPPPAPRPAWAAIGVLIALLAALAWFLPQTEPGTGVRAATYAGIAAAVLGLIWTVRRRR